MTRTTAFFLLVAVTSIGLLLWLSTLQEPIITEPIKEQYGHDVTR